MLIMFFNGTTLFNPHSYLFFDPIFERMSIFMKKPKVNQDESTMTFKGTVEFKCYTPRDPIGFT